jgi:hypothetical protein
MVFVSSPARPTAEGPDLVYTWIKSPSQAGSVVVTTLDAGQTTVGYYSRARIPVERPSLGQVVELQLVPIDDAEGVVMSRAWMSLASPPTLGLRLGAYQFDSWKPAFKITAEPTATLYESMPANSGWFGKKGRALEAVTQTGSFVLENGGEMYLGYCNAWNESGLQLEFYRQPQRDSEFLTRTAAECRKYNEYLARMRDSEK